MLARVRAVPLTAIVVAAVLGAGCSGGGGSAPGADRDREQAKAGWVLSLEGSPAGLALGRMDVYLSEDETGPEPFDIHGDGVRLVGVIPAALRVGYGEEFGKLVGNSLAFEPSGGDPSEPGISTVFVDGVPYSVTGGTFTIERLTGDREGSEGDKTLHGTVELRLLGSEGGRTVRGTMSVHAVTWG